eukprot:8545165-Pyramimonas_sp.AAC.1
MLDGGDSWPPTQLAKIGSSWGGTPAKCKFAQGFQNRLGRKRQRHQSSMARYASQGREKRENVE